MGSEKEAERLEAASRVIEETHPEWEAERQFEVLEFAMLSMRRMMWYGA